MGILNDGFADCTMALTVPVVSKFDVTARVTAVSSGKNLSYGQSNGVLKIGSDEFNTPTISGLYEFPYGDLIVGNSEGILIYREGKEIASHKHETGIDSVTGHQSNAVVIDGLGRAHLVDSKGHSTSVDASSVLFAK